MWQRIVEEAPEFFTYYNLVFLAEAALATFVLSAAGCVLGFAFGLGIAVARRTAGWELAPLRAAALLFTETFRRVPFLVTLLLVFYGFSALSLDVPVFAVALIAVVLIATAFIAEIVRGGMEAVHANQWDAAAAMNMSLVQTLRLVILPQAWRIILPPAFGFFILFIKDTALASQLGVLELTYAGKVLNNRGFSAALVFGTVLVLYFALSYPLTRLGAWMEARVASRRHR